MVYEPIAESAVNAQLQLELFTALADTFSPVVYSGLDDRKHRVTVQSGLKEVDKALGGLCGFVELTGTGCNNALRLLGRYSFDANKQGLNTLLLTPSRGKSAYFHEITQRWSASVHSLLILSFSTLLQTLISLKNGALPGDLVLIDGLSMLFLSGNGVPSDGREDYLSALISEIKAVSRDRTVIVSGNAGISRFERRREANWVGRVARKRAKEH